MTRPRILVAGAVLAVAGILFPLSQRAQARPGIIGTADHVIPPAGQLVTARRAGAHITMINSGHLPLITHPAAVARVILQAARAVG